MVWPSSFWVCGFVMPLSIHLHFQCTTMLTVPCNDEDQRFQCACFLEHHLFAPSAISLNHTFSQNNLVTSLSLKVLLKAFWCSFSMHCKSLWSLNSLVRSWSYVAFTALLSAIKLLPIIGCSFKWVDVKSISLSMLIAIPGWSNVPGSWTTILITPRNGTSHRLQCDW